MNPERIDAPTMREAGLPKNLSVKPILPPVMRTRIIQMEVFFNNLAVSRSMFVLFKIYFII